MYIYVHLCLFTLITYVMYLLKAMDNKANKKDDEKVMSEPKNLKIWTSEKRK